VKAVSPQDVGAAVGEHLNGSVDFAFIDGLHTNAQIVLDFDAVNKVLADKGVMAFHDVHEAKLREGFSQIQDQWPGEARILMATPSGIGILFPASLDDSAKSVVDAFTLSEEAHDFMKQQAWNRRHRHLARWKRSLGKRIGKLG
jgi:hypothetical protein